jgi:hypothetical protein
VLIATSCWSPSGFVARCVPSIYGCETTTSSTFDHRFEKIALPVRSAVLKLVTGGLVVRWVTTGEYPLLNVFDVFAYDAGAGTGLQS